MNYINLMLAKYITEYFTGFGQQLGQIHTSLMQQSQAIATLTTQNKQQQVKIEAQEIKHKKDISAFKKREIEMKKQVYALSHKLQTRDIEMDKQMDAISHKLQVRGFAMQKQIRDISHRSLINANNIASSKIVVGFTAVAGKRYRYGKWQRIQFPKVISNFGRFYNPKANECTCPVCFLSQFSVIMVQGHGLLS